MVQISDSVDKILNCVHQMKATGKYFRVVLFTMMYKMVLTFQSLDEILNGDQVLFVVPYTVVLPSESVDGILKCDLSNCSF